MDWQEDTNTMIVVESWEEREGGVVVMAADGSGGMLWTKQPFYFCTAGERAGHPADVVAESWGIGHGMQ